MCVYTSHPNLPAGPTNCDRLAGIGFKADELIRDETFTQLQERTLPSDSSVSLTIGAEGDCSNSNVDKRQETHYIVHHNYHDHADEEPDEEASKEHCPRRGGVTTPFPIKLHEMLDRVEADGFSDVVSWQPHGRCFVVHKPKEFKELLPSYFKQSKMGSFLRQLNLYGFSRLTRGRDKGGYYHELFLRGKHFLAYKIHRIKVKGTGVRARSNPSEEPDLWDMKWVEHSESNTASAVVSHSTEWEAAKVSSGSTVPGTVSLSSSAASLVGMNNSSSSTSLPMMNGYTSASLNRVNNSSSSLPHMNGGVGSLDDYLPNPVKVEFSAPAVIELSSPRRVDSGIVDCCNQQQEENVEYGSTVDEMMESLEKALVDDDADGSTYEPRVGPSRSISLGKLPELNFQKEDDDIIRSFGGMCFHYMDPLQLLAGEKKVRPTQLNGNTEKLLF